MRTSDENTCEACGKHMTDHPGMHMTCLRLCEAIELLKVIEWMLSDEGENKGASLQVKKKIAKFLNN